MGVCDDFLCWDVESYSDLSSKCFKAVFVFYNVVSLVKVVVFNHAATCFVFYMFIDGQQTLP